MTTILQPSADSRSMPHSGFTLVELLVVVAIISLLMAVLLPSLGKAREMARSIGCQSNNRTLLLGLQMYAEDNSGYVPEPLAQYSSYTFNGTLYTPSSGGSIQIMWFAQPNVGQYIGNTKCSGSIDNAVSTRAVYCPDVNVAKLGNKTYNGIGLNDFWNCKLHKDKPLKSDGSAGDPIRWSAYRFPSRFVLLGDSSTSNASGIVADTSGFMSWAEMTHQVDGVATYNSGSIAVNKYGVADYRHNNNMNIGFADGHVESNDDIVSALNSHAVTFVANGETSGY